MDEIKKYKKYIYISKEIQVELKTIVKKIILQ